MSGNGLFADRDLRPVSGGRVAERSKNEAKADALPNSVRAKIPIISTGNHSHTSADSVKRQYRIRVTDGDGQRRPYRKHPIGFPPRIR